MNTRSGRILRISDMRTFLSFQLFIEQINLCAMGHVGSRYKQPQDQASLSECRHSESV